MTTISDVNVGDRVRLTRVTEGVVTDTTHGLTYTHDTAYGIYTTKIADFDNVTIEILSRATPKPGTLWRDPETGNVWCATEHVSGRGGHDEGYALVSGEGESSGSWMFPSFLGRDRAVIARLVPWEADNA